MKLTGLQLKTPVRFSPADIRQPSVDLSAPGVTWDIDTEGRMVVVELPGRGARAIPFENVAAFDLADVDPSREKAEAYAADTQEKLEHPPGPLADPPPEEPPEPPMIDEKPQAPGPPEPEPGKKKPKAKRKRRTKKAKK